MSLRHVSGGAAAVLLAVTLAAGCSTDAGPPKGYQRVETGWMEIDIPEGWVHAGAVNDRWTDSYQDASGEAASMQLLLAPEFGDTDALVATSSVVSTAQVGGFPGFEVVPDDSKADEGHDYGLFNRVEFTYEGEDGIEYQGVLWGAADDGDDHVVLAQLTGADLDPELVATIEESIEVVGE